MREGEQNVQDQRGRAKEIGSSNYVPIQTKEE